MTNPAGWKLSTQLATFAAFVTSVMTIAAFYSAALDWQPFFALKTTVSAMERKAAFNRIADLGVQLDYLREREDRASSAAELGRIRDAITYATDEKRLLECGFNYIDCDGR